MVGWHHWINGHGFGWTPGVGDGHGGLACCGSWGHKELDMTERLSWLNWFSMVSMTAHCLCKYYIFEYILATSRYHLEKAMATHSSTLAWKIPWMEEPGRLQSTGSLRVGHDWATSLSLFPFMHWRRKWQPVFLPGESQGWGSLVGCCLWGRTESDTTEVT